MYENLLGNGHAHAVGGWKADLRDYARWEYGTEEAARWLLRTAGRTKLRRPSLGARIRAWLRPAAELPVATAVAVVENRGR